MTVYIENNQKYGEGYQIRVSYDGESGDVFDWRAYTLRQAIYMAGKLVDVINKRGGEQYELAGVVKIDDEALRDNRARDILSAKIYLSRKVLRYTKNELPEISMESEEDMPKSGADLALWLYRNWREDPNEAEWRKGVERYCKYLSMHGLGKSATAAFEELRRLPSDLGEKWVLTRFAEHVKNDEDLFLFLMDETYSEGY